MKKPNYKPFLCHRCNKEVIRTSGHQKYCKDCIKIVYLNRRKDYARKYYQNPKHNLRKYHLDYARVNRIRAVKNGKIIDITVRKRNFPKDGICELCNKPQKRLNYHHWEEIKKKKFLKGIWVCNKCHRFIEIVDYPKTFETIKNLYLQKKSEIEREFLS